MKARHRCTYNQRGVDVFSKLLNNYITGNKWRFINAKISLERTDFQMAL